MSSTDQFLTLLEEREILSARTVANLRAQVAQSPKPIAAELIAKRLVKHGHLTPAQAKRLLSAVEEAAPPTKPAAAKPAAARPQPKAEEDLGFAPIDDEPAAYRVKSRRPARPRPAKPAAQPPAERPAKSRLHRAGLRRARPHRPHEADKTSAAPKLPRQEARCSTRRCRRSVDPAWERSTGCCPTPRWLPRPAVRWRPLRPGAEASGDVFRRQPKVRKETESEKWGSPLMLLGGGGLLVMLFAGAWLWHALTSGNAEKMLRMADDSYNQGSYLQAIKQYDDYLVAFPKDAGASGGRVKKEMAKLRQATQLGSDWPTALKTADELLGHISTEKDFKEAYPELAAMLPLIAEGLADKARKTSDSALVDKSQQALAMVEKYVPKTLRQASASKLADVQASLAITKREIARDSELAKTLATMQKAVKESKTADAYTVCSAALRQYPDLADNAKLKARLLEVSRAQQTLVKWVAEVKPPAAADPPAGTAAVITLARRETKTEVPDVAGQCVLAAVDGAVYGLDAATGKVVWRRFIGFDANPRAASLPVLPLSSEAGGDALVVDTARNELLRIDGASGRVRWRYAVGEPFDARPVVADEKILLATPNGKLITISAATGESPGYVHLPQPLGVAPAVDGHRSLIYQVAARANLFILALGDGACRHVDFLGHERETVATAPLVVDDFLLLVVNDGARDAQLRVYLIQPKESGKPEPWLKLVQQIPLGGHVATPPLADGRRVLVATTSGIVRIFELGGAESKAPLKQIAESAIEGADNVIRFPLLQGGQLFVADNRLTKYDIQAARGRLEPNWIEDDQSAFLQPPAAVGQAVVAVRRKLGSPGAVVSARAMQGSELFWATELGVPPAGEPQVLDDGKAIVVTAGGAVFKIDAGATASAILGDPLVAPDVFRLPPPVKHVIRLSGGLLAVSSGKGSQQIGVFDPSSPTPLVTWLKLPDKDRLACTRWRWAAACWWRPWPARSASGTPSPTRRPANPCPWPSRSNPPSMSAPGSTGSPLRPSATRKPSSATGRRRFTAWAFKTTRSPTWPCWPRRRSPSRSSRPWPCWARRFMRPTRGRCWSGLAWRNSTAERNSRWAANSPGDPPASAMPSCWPPTTNSCSRWTPRGTASGRRRSSTGCWPALPCGSAGITCWPRGTESSPASMPPPARNWENWTSAARWPPGRCCAAGGCSSADSTAPSTKYGNHEHCHAD